MEQSFNTNSKAIESISTLNDGTVIIKFYDKQSTLESKESKSKENDFEKDKISQQAAAKMLDISVQTIINWRKRGLIQEYRIGKPVFYLKSELLQVFKQSKRAIDFK